MNILINMSYFYEIVLIIFIKSRKRDETSKNLYAFDYLN